MVRENGRKEKNKIALLRQKLSDANKDLDKVNDALHNLRMAEDDLQETQEPKLSDYYKPSKKMKMYMETFTRALGIGIRLFGRLATVLNLKSIECYHTFEGMVTYKMSVRLFD